MIVNAGEQPTERSTTQRQLNEGGDRNHESDVYCSSFVAGCTTASWAAEDGAALYKSKCAGCHGANGEGKPAIKAPALKGTTLDASQIARHLTKGEPQSKAPHNKGISGLNEQQARAIADFVKTLK
jgi:mono/diheme cytochrome c family protein